MRRKYFAGSDTIRLAGIDAIITLFSVSIALTIRSGFAYFLVDAVDVAVLVPLLIATRFLSLVLFEEYSFRTNLWKPTDITSLALHAFPATALMLILRLLSPIPLFRLPISVIFVEYLVSLGMMVLYRAHLLGVTSKNGSQTAHHRPRIMIWGCVQSLRSTNAVQRLESDDRYIVRGVLTPDLLFVDTDYSGYRILGDEHAIPGILQSDDSISTIILVEPMKTPLVRLKALFEYAKNARLTVLEYDTDGSFSSARLDDYRTASTP